MRFDAGPVTAWSAVPGPRCQQPKQSSARRGRLPLVAIRPDYELIQVNGSRLSFGDASPVAPAGAINAVSYRAELRPTAREVLSHLLDPAAAVVARSRLTGGRSIEDFEAAGSDDSSWSLDSATAAAAALLGEPVRETGGGATVEAVRSDTHGLRCSDVITAVDGEPVATAVDLRARLAGSDRVRLAVTRGSGPAAALSEIDLARQADGAWGIRVVTAHRALHHGLRASFELPDDLRGPSLGLACALSVVDALTGGGLAGNGAVVATGTVDLAGRVGGVGAIEYKARAVRAHPYVRRFLVPADPVTDVEDARRELAGCAEVVAVSTLAEAVEVLGGSGWRRRVRVNRRSRDRSWAATAR